MSAATPLMVNILGQQAPALSMLVGLITVIFTRIMLLSTEPKTKQGWWYYNVSLTILLTVIVFVIIIDRQLGPGLSLCLGVVIGASGILVVDIFKTWAQNFVAVFLGVKKNEYRSRPTDDA